MMHVVLISTYELGRQPFGLASPAAWLRQAGAGVTCLDLAVQRLDDEAIAAADLVCLYLPMHTATRIATRVVPRVRALNPRAHLCFYGLYAPMNESFLRGLGADTILGGEYEAGLLSLVRRLDSTHGTATPGPQREPVVSMAKQQFLVPDRQGLPPLTKYAQVDLGSGTTRTAGYTEASRGCKHLCRHCPIVPVYQGVFRVVQQDVVLEDIRRQVAAGAEHITFGDPDFFNGIGHALSIVRALHREYPRLTYDVTIKIEHVLQHAQHLPTLKETGCLLITSAVESIDDRVLALLDKGHTRDDFRRALQLCREAGLVLHPTFVPFTPWITIEGYQDLLALLAELDLIDHVAPIQLAIRLLIPAGSKLLDLPEVREIVGPFDEAALIHPWRHRDPSVDQLQADIEALVRTEAADGRSRRETFSRVWMLAERASGAAPRRPLQTTDHLPHRAAIPFLTEPWYC
jgi:radical SAM superfamily enzyme YgiQ (UPF0313 family)